MDFTVTFAVDLEGQTAAAHDEITLCLIEGGQLKS